MKVSTVLAVLAASVRAKDISLAQEKPGGLFRSVSIPGAVCDNKVLRDSQPVGQMQDIGGVQSYVTEAADKNSKLVILYLSDIFGLPLANNKLLADSFAKAGFHVVFPDLFKGDYIPANAMANNSGFDMAGWRARHPIAGVDAIIDSTIKAAKDRYKVQRVAAVGYCFGGKYVARFLKKGRGVDVGFVAHPSNITKEEAKDIEYPISVAYADNDNRSNPPETRDQFEEIMFQNGNLWEQTLYSWTEHGFAVRANMSDPRSQYAQESAYIQAVRWFNQWLPAS